MKRTCYLILLALLASLLVACSPASKPATKVKPAEVLKVEGSEFSRVVLTQKAFERLGIQTEPVSSQVITHKRTVTGEVIDPKELADKVTLQPGQVLVRVFVSQDDIADIDSEEGAEVASLEDDEDIDGLPATLSERLAGVNGQENEGQSLVFIVDNTDNRIKADERVLVDLLTRGSGTQAKVIPYAAVIYGVKGETWVYTNPQPLVYIRQPVVIDYIEDELAVLKEGPEPGAAVVTVGVAELYGAETGVSK